MTKFVCVAKQLIGSVTGKESIDLYSLLAVLREGVGEMFPDKLWVRAEVSSVSARNNGHCYLELSQTDGGQVTAKARAVIWRSRYALLSKYFRDATGGDLAAGVTVLVRVQVSYSELYGLTLVIDDIDADVTLGEQERRRRETVARLREEGLIDLQQELCLPPLPYRLAVISAHDAAGYGDFCHHLLDNEYGFRFRVDLFEAAMQGAAAPASIASAIEAVEQSGTHYDALLILRGGGSVLDLACYDDYSLCAAIARCPIPVLTAIGHDRDFHVTDMVSLIHVKTPTALADVFIDCYAAEDERLSSYAGRLKAAFLSKITRMESRLDLLLGRIHAADPRAVLSRGYTLAVDKSGHVLKSSAGLERGDEVRLMFADGTVVLEVKGKI